MTIKKRVTCFSDSELPSTLINAINADMTVPELLHLIACIKCQRRLVRFSQFALEMFYSEKLSMHLFAPISIYDAAILLLKNDIGEEVSADQLEAIFKEMENNEDYAFYVEKAMRVMEEVIAGFEVGNMLRFGSEATEVYTLIADKILANGYKINKIYFLPSALS